MGSLELIVCQTATQQALRGSWKPVAKIKVPFLMRSLLALRPHLSSPHLAFLLSTDLRVGG